MSIPTSTFNAMGFSRYGRGQATSYVRRCLGGNFESACIQNDLDTTPTPTRTLTLSQSAHTVLSSTSVATDWFSVIASGLDPIVLALDPNHSWTVQATMPAPRLTPTGNPKTPPRQSFAFSSQPRAEPPLRQENWRCAWTCPTHRPHPCLCFQLTLIRTRPMRPKTPTALIFKPSTRM